MKFDGKVLLVDDEAHVRKFVGLIVRGLGEPTLLEATNGREAVEIYQRESPDLVLLDVNMPILDGLGTLREIMAIDPEAVIVMLTSLANRQTVEEALERGATNYIRKDTPRDEIKKSLSDTINAVFGSEESADAAI
ncbi:MAG TPA: response regulator [Opitutaceae bacterium]|jgi:two-component system, chemotaxis family, chemotaxis protein CheY|nr:response regulator [Opitutaceae bacterium]HRE04570.1 response regulator [Opitutaceae bacterium]